jgi:hypothetical protein
MDFSNYFGQLMDQVTQQGGIATASIGNNVALVFAALLTFAVIMIDQFEEL